MYRIQDLRTVSLRNLHETFLEAFSDYQIPIDLSASRLQHMLTRRGYIAGASLGAFDGETLVGFLLHGVREWRGLATAYDTGTGVVPAHRKMGITTELLSKAGTLLQYLHIQQWLLEVLQENGKAMRLYEREGFTVIREFDCFISSGAELPGRGDFPVMLNTGFTGEEWEEVHSFIDYEPSWQNARASIQAVPESFIYATVRSEAGILGYGVIDRSSGDIPQIAVRPDTQGRGIGTALLRAMVHTTDAKRVTCTNVDSRCASLKGFLHHHGFTIDVRQYEMMRKL